MNTTSTLDQLNAFTNHLGQLAMTFYVSSLGFFEFASVVISAILIACIIVIIQKTNWFGAKVHNLRHAMIETDLSKEEAKKSWVNIKRLFFKGDDNDLKIAVIEADKLLEEALRESGIRGISLGDRLKNIKPGQLQDIDKVWQAHRLRNQIVHEPTFKLKRDLAERALDIYEKTLKQLGLLQGD
jgi:hypothetical protein